ncbi:hypothetical protein GCM10008949_33910 [Deinococcus humi]|nr:hypothetical protein GCM10008949_33910 [Deinococcus humi]
MDQGAETVSKEKDPAVVLTQLAVGVLATDDGFIALKKIFDGVVIRPAQQYRAFLALRQLLPHTIQTALTYGVVRDPQDNSVMLFSGATPHILASALRPLIPDPDRTAQAVRTMAPWIRAETKGPKYVGFTLTSLENDWNQMYLLYGAIKSRCRKMNFNIPWADADHADCERVARNLCRRPAIRSWLITSLAQEYGVESAGHAMYLLAQEYLRREKL